MNQERYWRNLIADEIKAEMSRVEAYYMKRGMNSGGMSPEEHTRLNIFRLCESVARAMKDSPDAPQDVPKAPITFSSNTIEPMPEPVVDIVPDTTVQETIIEDTNVIADNVPFIGDQMHKLVKDTPRQNQFGEFL